MLGTYTPFCTGCQGIWTEIGTEDGMEVQILRKKSWEGSWLKQSLYPNQTQVEVSVVLAEALYSAQVSGCMLEVQEAVEILLDDDIAKIDGHRAYEAEFLVIPKGGGYIADPVFQRVASAYLVACATGAAVDRIEIRGNGVAVITKGADDEVETGGLLSIEWSWEN